MSAVLGCKAWFSSSYPYWEAQSARLLEWQQVELLSARTCNRWDQEYCISVTAVAHRICTHTPSLNFYLLFECLSEKLVGETCHMYEGDCHHVLSLISETSALCGCFTRSLWLSLRWAWQSHLKLHYMGVFTHSKSNVYCTTFIDVKLNYRLYVPIIYY